MTAESEWACGERGGRGVGGATDRQAAIDLVWRSAQPWACIPAAPPVL
eukprot:COSAG01_NODE_405_length_17466_cov_554.403697_2_plen_48_part_00